MNKTEVVVAGSDSPDAPVVILFHGRGSNAHEIMQLVPHLPQGIRYLAVDAPIGAGGNYAWFANRGIGRPIEESLRETTTWFTDWLDSYLDPAVKPILIGNSGGGAFVGGLIGLDKNRYAGAGILYATLPWDAGIELAPGSFTDFPIFVAHGTSDNVIPADLLARTWEYLTTSSGAKLSAHRGPEGHGLSQDSLAKLNEWILETIESTEQK